MPQSTPARAFAKLFSYLLRLAIVVLVVGCTKSSQHDAVLLTFQLTSNSMSPTFFGPHHQATCKKCGYSWKIAAETLGRERNKAVCSVCGDKCTIGELVRGQQVTARSLVPKQNPQRLDCIVFDANAGKESAAREWACKRIWGLPGETIELRNGELIVDGQLFQKDAKQMLGVAIPLAGFPPTGRADLFELGKPNSTEIHRFPTALSFAGKTTVLSLNAGETVAWNNPVVDDYPQDFSTPRNLVQLYDLLFEIEFADHRDSQVGDKGNERANLDEPPRSLVLNFEYRGESVEIQCLFGHNLTDRVPDASDSMRFEKDTLCNPQRIYCGGWDGQLYCVVNQQIDALPLKHPPTGSAPEPDTSAATQFSLSILNGPVRIKKLAVLRDLYLRANERDLSNGQPESTQLAADEYFVIGDNLPISIDSRNGLGNLRRQQIWGVVE